MNCQSLYHDIHGVTSHQHLLSCTAWHRGALSLVGFKQQLLHSDHTFPLPHCEVLGYFPTWSVFLRGSLPACLSGLLCAHFLSSPPACSLFFSLPVGCLLEEGQHAWGGGGERGGGGGNAIISQCVCKTCPHSGACLFSLLLGFFFLSPCPAFAPVVAFPPPVACMVVLMENAETVTMLNINAKTQNREARGQEGNTWYLYLGFSMTQLTFLLFWFL